MGGAGVRLTTASDGAQLVASLRAQRDAWEARPAVRALYREWHEMIVARLSRAEGETVELGCGFGAFKEVYPPALATDIQPTPWADAVADAEALPFADGSLANLVMIDVLHHLPHPGRFFTEADRVLAPGGRMIAVEPYCSGLSGIAYRRFHREGANTRVDPFGASAQSSDDPLDANNALPTLIFWGHAERFARDWTTLSVLDRKRFAFLAYPASGGFEGRRLAPDGLVRGLARIERLLSPLAALAAFRCLIVVERRRG